jgi:hypothetical protein
MTIFRWIMGVISLLLCGGAALCFTIFIALDIQSWIERARVFRRLAYMALLFWFNIEIWGRVLWTLIHW